jgi:hypothetical protein
VDQNQETLLVLISRSIRFATDHPYAATAIFGAAVGSAVTYRAMTVSGIRQKANQVFTPKVYQFAVPEADLRRMLIDPSYELRWEFPEASMIVSAEKREHLKQLPIVESEEK